ncbi:MAG: response regulator [Chloroflexi bacterium]|nr:response regulator [Chloroflexota bacterium]MBV9597874.1 response regulator [Chloroflexota bacterium]
MLQKEWPILIVDDEPDVLAVTRLVLKDVQVDGVPLKLQTASSKAEAIQLLTDAPGPPGAPSFAVALIDVVMETPTAGLELCDFVRNNLKNKTAQLFIRTGQAGLAPERAVVDRYDVNGYFTKVESTDDKLYSMVKTGVRQNEYLVSSQVLFQILSRVAGQPRPAIERMLGAYGVFLHQNQVSVGIMADGSVLSAIGYDRSEVPTECQRLEALPSTPLSAAGDIAVYQDRTALFKSAEGDYLIYRNVSPPSPSLQLLHISYLKLLGTLARAGATASASKTGV